MPLALSKESKDRERKINNARRRESERGIRNWGRSVVIKDEAERLGFILVESGNRGSIDNSYRLRIRWVDEWMAEKHKKDLEFFNFELLKALTTVGFYFSWRYHRWIWISIFFFLLLYIHLRTTSWYDIAQHYTILEKSRSCVSRFQIYIFIWLLWVSNLFEIMV